MARPRGRTDLHHGCFRFQCPTLENTITAGISEYTMGTGAQDAAVDLEQLRTGAQHRVEYLTGGQDRVLATYIMRLVFAIASYVPIVSSIAMPVRLLEGQAQIWEPFVALGVCLAFGWFMLRLGEKVYQRAVFQGGRSLKWREALKIEQ